MFDGQKPDEKILFIEKQHPAVTFRVILFLILLSLLPITFFIFFKFSQLFFYTLAIWFIIVCAYGIRAWYCYTNSKYILTTYRLINIEQKGVFHKTVSEAPLSRIQDVNFEVKGLWPSIFDFGTINFQTASGQEKIHFRNVEEPKKIQAQIVEAVEAAEKKDQDKESKKDKFWE